MRKNATETIQLNIIYSAYQKQAKRSIQRFLEKSYFKTYCLSLLPKKDIRKVNELQIRRILHYWISSDLTSSMIFLLNAVLNDFLNFCVEKNVLLENPLNHCERGKRNPLPLTYEQKRRVWEVQKRFAENRYNYKRNLCAYTNAIANALAVANALTIDNTFAFALNDEFTFYTNSNSYKECENSFKTKFEEYLYLEFNVGKSIINNHLNVFYNYAYPLIQDKDVTKVTMDDIKLIEIVMRSNNASNQLLAFFYRTMKSFYNYLIAQGVVEKNLLDNHEKIVIDNLGRTPLTMNQLKALVVYLKKEKPIIEGLFGLLICYGLRKSECLGLTLDSINLKEGVITIDKQLLMKIEVDHTKTRSIRKLKMNPLSIYYLNKIIAQHKIWAKNKEYKNDRQFLFTDSTGEPLSDSSLRLVLVRMGIFLKQRDLTFHSFRHTYVTLSSEINGNLIRTQKSIGHEKIETTIHHYLHVTNESRLKTVHLTEQYYIQLIKEKLKEEENE